MAEKKTNLQLTALLVWVLITAAYAAGQEYDMSRRTNDGGGVMFSTGGDFELSGTIGQPDAGVMTGDGLSLSGGFWFEEPPGDCNSTGNVNLLDYGDLKACLSGPGGGLLMPGCNCFDVDNDEDVDLSDMALFQISFTNG
ncbi:MAG: hypothetical protein ACYTFA_09235 [Planctomycetota bacterium]|jgi:hypothetical protein